MGVDNTVYVMYGVQIPYADLDSDEFLNEMEMNSEKRFDMIYDGMNGKYVFAGHIILNKDYFSEGEYFVRISDFKPNESYIKNIRKVFPNLRQEDFGYYFIDHYS